jgi:hypothetical protein
MSKALFALLCLLLWSGARCTRVEDLARQRLSLSQRDAAEHERPSPRSGRRMFGRGTGRSYPPGKLSRLVDRGHIVARRRGNDRPHMGG